MVADREDLDYSRYRDVIADYLTERDYLQGRYDSEKGFDYGKYVDDRNMDYTLHADGYQKLLDALGIARDDYYSGADMHYTEQANKNSEAWNQAKWEEAARQYANEEAWRQKEWDENQKRYEESKTASENSSGIKINSDGTVDLSSIPGINTSDATWFDKNGQFKSAEYLGPSTDGKSSFRIDGKTVTYPIGTNPYTQTENPDIHNFNGEGAFKNGYQPNNVGGKKLSKAGDGFTDYINGVEQNIWKTEDGTLYIWDELQNKYLIYHE